MQWPFPILLLTQKTRYWYNKIGLSIHNRHYCDKLYLQASYKNFVDAWLSLSFIGASLELNQSSLWTSSGLHWSFMEFHRNFIGDLFDIHWSSMETSSLLPKSFFRASSELHMSFMETSSLSSLSFFRAWLDLHRIFIGTSLYIHWNFIWSFVSASWSFIRLRTKLDLNCLQRKNLCHQFYSNNKRDIQVTSGVKRNNCTWK